jgi:hypothetical protein
MFRKPVHSSHRQASSPPARPARWRVWTALLAAITFIVLVSTAATHHHATTVDDQDCAICSVVTHKLADLPLVKLPKLVVILVSYAPFLRAAPSVAHASPLRLPPSCGPPALSPPIC